MDELPSSIPPGNQPPEMDYFDYLCGQIQQVYVDAYYKATNEKEYDKATYYRGKLDAYLEVRRHYQELKK